MKTVLAFCDSLTWGADQTTRLRHLPQYRWPDVRSDIKGMIVSPWYSRFDVVRKER